MFHVVNRVYFEHHQWYSTKTDALVLSSVEAPHPANHPGGVNFGVIKGYQEFLDTVFSGLEESFWESLLNRPTEKSYVVFMDQLLKDRLQIQYWKSIFKKPEVKDIYKLYRLYYSDQVLKTFSFKGREDAFRNEKKHPLPMSFSEFNNVYNEVKPIELLQRVDKASVSFEYLLANYFLDKNSRYSSSFLEKLKSLSRKAMFGNLDILRNEVINSFYDIHRIVPGTKFDVMGTDSIEKFIMSEPKLQWLLDPNFSEENMDYIIKTYPKELFLDLSNKMRECWDAGFKKIAGESNESDLEDHVLLIKMVYEERFEELLLNSVSKSFGCVFVNDHLCTKANQILPLYIYEKVRDNKLSDIEFLRLN